MIGDSILNIVVGLLAISLIALPIIVLAVYWPVSLAYVLAASFIGLLAHEVGEYLLLR